MLVYFLTVLVTAGWESRKCFVSLSNLIGSFLKGGLWGPYTIVRGESLTSGAS
jgi:hypothetical protein